jgi:serine/threonine protein phosphatase PrpC
VNLYCTTFARKSSPCYKVKKSQAVGSDKASSDREFVVGHLGDSRAYRFRSGPLKQLTRDHSIIQDHIDKGLKAPEYAWWHPLRHVIL